MLQELPDRISLAEDLLLFSAKLDKDKLDKVFRRISNKSIDYADLYFQAIQKENWYLEDNIVKSGSYGSSKGVGIRAVSYDKVGFAFSDNISLASLELAANAARGISLLKDNNNVKPLNTSNNITAETINLSINYYDKLVKHHLYEATNPLISSSDQKKINLLQYINKLARDLDPRVQQVIASLVGTYEVILIVTSDGVYQADVRPLIKLNITVIVKQGDRLEQGIAGGGGRLASYDHFTKNSFEIANNYTKKAVALAITNLDAVPAPAGVMPVVLGSGWPGVLLHEAIGHGLEGDAIRKGSSVFTNKLGAAVASDLCTIVDNGAIPNARGSLVVDDEGTPTQNTILIEQGILTSYLQDKLNAKLTSQRSTGNSRRQSYAHIPIPRMTNTYMLPGTSAPNDIINSVNKGIYAVNFSGGQVDVTSGKFVFEANEAYLIENGCLKDPIKGATIIGDGAQVLKKIELVGNDLELDPGIGTCGKDGQNVPVNVGQPTLLIRELIIGGTEC